MKELIMATIIMAVFITLIIYLLSKSTTDDETVADFEYIQDLKEKALYEMRYYGKVSQETLDELERMEKKYGL